MTRSAILKLLPIVVLFCCTQILYSQKPINPKEPVITVTSEAKPYKILTNGKRITVQSKTNIKSMLVWTSGGHRIIEQNNLNNTSYSFDISIKEKIFFLMIELVNGKRYTEKIGVK